MNATPAPGSTPPPDRDLHAPAVVAPDPHPLTPWKRWCNFWFPRSDPTTLGFIRISTGLLVLYIHLAYSLDLQAFFGKHAWYATAFIDRERHEIPHYLAPFWGGWDDKLTIPTLSNYPHRQKALMDFLRGLPADKVERMQALRYLDRANAFQNPVDFQKAMFYVQNMGTHPDRLNSFLAVLTVGKLDDPNLTKAENESQTRAYEQDTPGFFKALPPEERAAVAEEVRAFWTALGKIQWTDPSEGRRYVFNHFTETNPEIRKVLVEYLDKLPDDPAARKQMLDYMDYWNSDSRKAFRVGLGIFSIWFHVTDPTEMALVHTGILVVMVLFTIGLFTRVTSVLTWLAAVSYIHRTQQVLFGMDTMMNILLFYLMIGNCGAALSVDRLIARYRAARASLGRSGTIEPHVRAFLACPQPSTSAGFALRLIQVHFCFIYMAAGLSKLKGETWWTGQAFWGVVVNPEFTLMQYDWYRIALVKLASVKVIYYITVVGAVWTTLFVEIATPFLIWTRLRWFVILLASAMHAVIGVLMGLNLFELLMIVMLLAFFPDRVIRDRFRGGPDLRRLGFTFNPQKPAHVQAAALALAGDVDNQIALNADKTATGTAVLDPDGKPEVGTAGVATLFRYVRLLSILGFVLWIPGVKGLFAKRFFPTAEPPAGGTGTTGKPVTIKPTARS